MCVSCPVPPWGVLCPVLVHTCSHPGVQLPQPPLGTPVFLFFSASARVWGLSDCPQLMAVLSLHYFVRLSADTPSSRKPPLLSEWGT